VSNRKVNRGIEYHKLDVIISFRYHVKTKEGTQFRFWTNRVLKEYLLKGDAINQRMNRIENTVEDLAKKVSEIDSLDLILLNKSIDHSNFSKQITGFFIERSTSYFF
jgi:hypothetical protein